MSIQHRGHAEALSDRLEMAGETFAQGVDHVLAACLAFVDRFFDSRHIRGVDFCLCVISAGWVWSVARNPDVMGRLAYAGLSFFSRDVVLMLFASLAIGHLVGFLNPHFRTFRVLVLLVSAFVWVVIGAFMAWAVTTGGATYLVCGFVAVISIVHLERSRV